MTGQDRERAASAQRPLEVLELLGSQPSVTVDDLVERWGISRSSVRRTLDLLLQRGFLRRSGDRDEFEGGAALIRIGSAIQRRSTLVGLVRPTLEWMAAESRETAHFAVLEGSSIRFVLGIEGHRAAVGARARTGEVIPAYTASLGRRILATMQDAEVEALYPDPTLPLRHGALVERSGLLAELDRIRREGYAINQDEDALGGRAAFEGVGSTSQVVPRAGGSAAAGISIAGPRLRLTEDVRRWHRAILDRAARELAFVYDHPW